MTGITTHILDLTHGTPASHVKIELFIQEGTSGWKHLKTTATNDDGRLDVPLLTEEEMKIGVYELIFHIGEYFRRKDIPLPDPPFLELVPVRFGISDVNRHYHVPLLVSPWGYQVYRGS
ncbi:hydroxyisourate hydrolase [Niallia endozanthoxylica]|uniref:5-hydroxyisourate hydrolase n=1 Tax=Niallia endozanthoxylica TaxID=2036016 RepID=A0A5J5I0W3_9BACI|nr:hydroxyisourate hydrolase [Niallia endozanthoxylica]KAA9028583.1 hydroxyisourate hydrolase [Niallia endozanthoxylica]